ncbi:MAG: alanine--tRNA ligase [Bacteroidaceae bacterium]|nr:alanine--tRNA ligase [Bacteroidaceae bacterium]
MLTSKEIRESFKEFFKEKGHLIVPSAPMVVKDDPTLMFTNAGMNQFKDIILGNRPAKSKRVADSQKCLRVSGKHNDLEEVGHDTYHHTMFEMLGNWSFGDYFKEEAITWAWEYLTKVVKIDPERLYATVFEGCKAENLERDNEAAAIWERYLPTDRIINGNLKDNFWEMGDTGPCGPSSEIHVDLRSNEERAAIPGRDLVNGSHPQVIEIWNLVFMQYNRMADGHLEELPAKVIDTGMGFERLCMALQGKTSNYDTDIFQPIIKSISEISGKNYGEDAQTDIAMRVIADHIRTISFSITDGQLPSNAKAGYVIRRILRRAVRYGYTFLGQKQAFMYKLVPILIENMGDAYPELGQQRELVTKVIKEEEESFLRTLETGINLLNKVIATAKAEGKKEISGVEAFTLYDTFGFPIDLTQLILRENDLDVNMQQFDEEMLKQKTRARNAAAVENSDWTNIAEGESRFIGYDLAECDTTILRYRQTKQKNQTLYQIVLSETPFYAESGGQVGDTGVLICGDEKIEVIDTKKENNLPIHITKKLPANPEATFHAQVNIAKRKACAANHSCTHLLDQALREVLGTHVEQKGSLVTPEGIRFDFSHFQKLSNEEIVKVEKAVNARIRANIPLTEYRDIPIAEAQQLGAIALFGEKYGDRVRVIQFDKSIEFCGGIHANATGEIGMVKIISESSVAAGVRRIEAITGEALEENIIKMQDMMAEIKALFNNVPNLKATIVKAINENNELKKQVEEYSREKAVATKDKLLGEAKERKGIRVISAILPLPAATVKDIVFMLRSEMPDNLLCVIGSIQNDKPQLTISASGDLVEAGINAGKLVGQAAKEMQGGGGGQPHFATAGGKNIDGLKNAMNKVFELVEI